ncbi:MAG: response regulator [Phenylobacterium sp.]|uniref:ATP-binding protein n=1 Tax=Phenylobacterium sp. TaxID=1871053 RepID=UPI001B60A00E|nr:ATP-binding protein [Phenylobacterium sp.]MBP7815039.1 response regulator [Phenylobacterium sp.]MBP9754249.1 response regulator [Phenylobacterium sp.]
MPKLPNLAGLFRRAPFSWPPRFTRLRTRLTVLYAGLFVALLFAILLSVYAAVARNAERVVREELSVSGLVFDRIWALRARELESGANVLARDFGFRAAVAGRDAASLQSALDDLRPRVGADAAFIVDRDGRVLTASSPSPARPGRAALNAIAGQDAAAGVFVMAGVPYQAVSAPILTPTLSGWVVFAVRLDQAEMNALEQLSAIPLRPVVLVRGADGGWKANTWAASTAELEAVDRFLDGPQPERRAGVTRIGREVAVIQPLAAITQDRVVLLLRYPLAGALAPYNLLLGGLLLLTLLGIGLIAAGSWALDRKITAPLLALRDAAEGLERGEAVQVEPAGTDEIGALERSFNAMARGIAEREGALKLSAEKAQAAHRAKSEFLSQVGREIRTPLNALLGMARIMAREPADAAHDQRLAVIGESGEALLKILNGILDISKADTAALEARDFDLAALVRAACATDAKAAKAKRLTFDIAVAAESQGRWRGAARRLSLALSNLVSNAVKFTSEGGVTVAVDHGNGVVRFRIADTGVGIPAERIEAVHETLRQADASAARAAGGSGSGLSVAHEMATLLGGKVSVASEEGRGSVFTLEVPLQRLSGAASADKPAAALADLEPNAEAAPLRVLAAEDNKTNQLILTSLLEPFGVDLTLVENGREAAELFATGDFDLVLMDIEMPEMSGVEATRAIRRGEAERGGAATPILAVTANLMAEEVAEYLAVGMNGVVAKPIEAEQLFAAIQAAVEGAPEPAAQAA